MFSNVRIGLLASKQEFKTLHFEIELWLTGTFFDRILFYSCPDIGNSYVLFEYEIEFVQTINSRMLKTIWCNHITANVTD